MLNLLNLLSLHLRDIVHNVCKVMKPLNTSEIEQDLVDLLCLALGKTMARSGSL